MKKTARILLAFLMLFVLVSALCACKKSQTVYYGAVVKYEESLCVKMGNISIAFLPNKNGVYGGETVEIAEGDIIKMTFEGECYFRETYPMKFGNKPEIEIYRRGFMTAYDESGYTISIDAGTVEGEAKSGGNLEITSGETVLQTVKIKSVAENKIEIYIENSNISGFFKVLAAENTITAK